MNLYYSAPIFSKKIFMKRVFKVIAISVVLLFNVFCCLRAQTLDWSVQVIAGGAPYGGPAEFVSSDAAGNVYVAGSYSDSLLYVPGGEGFENYSYSLPGSAHISKFALDGTLLWSKRFLCESPGSFMVSMTTDSNGNIYLYGRYNESITLLPGSATPILEAFGSEEEKFLIKLDTDGNFVWGHSIELNYYASSEGFPLFVDSSGNVYLGGKYFEDVFVDGVLTQVHTPSTIIGIVCLMSFDQSGQLNWIKSYGNEATGTYDVAIYAGGLAENSAGNICVSFSFSTSTPVDFAPDEGGYIISSLTNTEILLLTLTQDGNFVELKEIGETVEDYFGFGRTLIGLDEFDNITIGTELSGTVDVDPGPAVYPVVVSDTTVLAVVLKYSATGEFLWARPMSGTYSALDKLSTDQAGSVYFTGNYSGIIGFNAGSETIEYTAPFNSLSRFFVKYSAEGNLIWVHEHIAGFNSVTLGSNPENSIFLTTAFPSQDDYDLFGSTIVPATPEGPGIVIMRLLQDDCSDMHVVMQASNEVECGGAPGEAQAYVFGGLPPLTYTWNTTPVQTTATMQTEIPGIYTFTVVDDNGCQKEQSVLVNGGYIGETDLRTDILLYTNSTPYVPSLTSAFKVMASNQGCIDATGNLVVTLDPLLSYVSASITPSSVNGNTLAFSSIPLSYNDTDFEVEIFAQTITTAQMNDSICIDASITLLSGSDVLLSNNASSACGNVLTSYDPNIKSVSPIGACEERYVPIDQRLTYTVQFQNTGTYEALNIYVMDTLSSAFDINSLRVIANSHDFVTEVYDGNVIKFRFPNIHLADSTSNEAESHGYIIFEIDPLPTIPSGTLIENRVGIYFDFNEPVITNSVRNVFVNTLPECAVDIDENNLVSSLDVYPNPTMRELNVTLPIGANAKDVIAIYDMHGRLIQEQLAGKYGGILSVDIQHLSSGMYVLRYQGKDVVLVEQFVKE